MALEEIDLLDDALTSWQIEEIEGIGYRYQGTPLGSIIGFFGYADTREEAVTRLLAKGKVSA